MPVLNISYTGQCYKHYYGVMPFAYPTPSVGKNFSKLTNK